MPHAVPGFEGMFPGGAPEAIGNSMFWNTALCPSNGLIFPSYQPPLVATLGRMGGGRMGLLFRRFADQP